MMSSTKSTTQAPRAAEALLALGVTAPRGSTPLPRRWARAKAWSQRRAAGPPDLQHIKLMLQAEKANRG
jgi:hypothetical protein